MSMDVAREVQTASQARGPKKRTGTSKYDFLKVVHSMITLRGSRSYYSRLIMPTVALQVKVWLGDNMDHYYILSRFLICRMLTVTKIPYIKVGTTLQARLSWLVLSPSAFAVCAPA